MPTYELHDTHDQTVARRKAELEALREQVRSVAIEIRKLPKDLGRRTAGDVDEEEDEENLLAELQTRRPAAAACRHLECWQQQQQQLLKLFAKKINGEKKGYLEDLGNIERYVETIVDEDQWQEQLGFCKCWISLQTCTVQSLRGLHQKIMHTPERAPQQQQ